MPFSAAHHFLFQMMWPSWTVDDKW